jgi:hypothetical protein
MVSARQQLTKKILDFSKIIDFSKIQDNDFAFENDLGHLWFQCKNEKTIREKWPDFVKYVLFDKVERYYISKQLMRLNYESKGSLDNFVVSTEEGNFSLPDRLGLFLRLQILKDDFSKIYRRINSRINFDFPQKEFAENRIRGKIDWNKTSRNSLGNFPIKFYTKSPIREFDTPENILLVLCVNWIKIDSKKILSTDLEPPLSIDERSVLINIHNSMTDLINYFPFSDVIRQVSNLTIYARNSPEINQLRRKVNERIREGRVKNVEYVHLLNWIHKYLDLGMDGGIKDQNTPVMENLTSINTLYELLIFFEFFVYLKNEQNCNPQIHVRTENKQIKYTIEFMIEQKLVSFEYDKEYSFENNKEGKKWPAWILTSRPDYSVVVNNKIIAVFDAKNYFKMGKELEEKYAYYKIYQKGLKGFPTISKENVTTHIKNYPDIEKEITDYWEKFQDDENIAKEYYENLLKTFLINNESMVKEYKKLNVNFSTRVKEATRDILSYVTNLDVNYGAIIFPKKEYCEFTFPNEKEHVPKFHHNLKFEYLQLDYDPKNAISTRNDTVVKMYDAIKFAIESQPPEITA